MKLLLKSYQPAIKGRAISAPVNFSLSGGEILWLKGDSGSGKTMALKGLMGFVPYLGEISINGQSIENDQNHLTEIASYFPQEKIEYPFREVSRLLQYTKRKLKKRGLLSSQENLTALEAVINIDLLENKKLSKLSVGQYKRIGLYLSLLVPSKLILLDEPFAGQDDDFTSRFCDLMLSYAAAGSAIVIAEHRNLPEYFKKPINEYIIHNQ